MRTKSEERIYQNRNWLVIISLTLLCLGLALFIFWEYKNLTAVEAPVVAETDTSTPLDYTPPLDPAVLSQLNTAFTQMATKYSASSFQLSLVPTATIDIKVSAPNTDNTADVADYTAKVVAQSANAKALVAQDTIDQLLFDDQQPYTNVIENSLYRDQLFQIQDEIMYVAHTINALYQRAPVSERIPNVVLLTTPTPDPFSATTTLVYPAGRAVVGFTAGEIMARIDPLNATEYRAQSLAYAERGIAYGEYSKSDMVTAKSIVTQYFVLLEKTATYKKIFNQ